MAVSRIRRSRRNGSVSSTSSNSSQSQTVQATQSAPLPTAHLDSDIARLARFHISPREEEGHENLPEYTCPLSKEAVFRFKIEFLTPFERAITRKWERVYLVLRGTMLSVHHVKSPGLFHKSKGPELCDTPQGVTAGRLIRRYTLQHAEVGVAADYNKRSYVLRLRAEAEQFLLCSLELKTMVEWLEAIGAAINLALPLDERRQPEYRITPRRRLPRPAGAETLLREQLEIIQRHYPHLRDDEARAIVGAPTVREEQQAQNAPGSPADADGGILSRVSTGESVEDGARAHGSSQRLDGKWRPEVEPTPNITRNYARRYMGSVCEKQRRQTPFVVYKGKTHLVNFRETRLTPVRKLEVTSAAQLVDPPSYWDAEELAREEDLALERMSSGVAGWRPTMLERI